MGGRVERCIRFAAGEYIKEHLYILMGKWMVECIAEKMDGRMTGCRQGRTNGWMYVKQKMNNGAGNGGGGNRD